MIDGNSNFALVLDHSHQRHAACPALFHDRRTLSYADLAALIDAWAARLRARGVGPGRSVVLWLPNSPAFVAGFFATLRLGATAAPLGVLLKPREVRQRVALANPAALVTTPALAATLRDAGDAASVGADALVVDASGGGFPTATRLPAAVRAQEDVAVLVFTSGTTGTAKAAEITHGGMAWNARALAAGLALTPADVQLAVAPFSHVMGMSCVMNATLATGGALALMDRFDPARALALMAETGATVVTGAPPMFAALVREARKTTRLPRLRVAHAGGAPVVSELARAVAETFGCLVREGYGMSEVGGGISVAPVHGHAKPQSAGPALPGSALRIVDLATGATLPAGERGEVQVKSPSVMRGYLGDDAETRAVLDLDGWLSTGDIGYLDRDSHLFLVDRKKELIIRSGYNVYPREVEEVLSGCPGVLEAAVVGVPSEEHGEEIAALIVPSREGLDPDVVKSFARARLAAYKYPRHVFLVKELPKGPTGKVSKRDIDRRALMGAGDLRPRAVSS
jgi:long-chain acyl-CoA synthetase